MTDALDNLRVLIDWDRDATFTHALADVSGRVRYADWRWGFDAPGQLAAPPAGGTLVLDNTDGAFNVGRAGGAYADLLRPGVLVKFKHTIGPGGTTWAFLVLRVLDIRIAPSQFGERTVTLTLGDWHEDLMNAVYDPPLTTNVNTGQAVYNAMDTALVPLPHTSYWWVMDGSALDVDTRLFSFVIGGETSFIFFPGQTTLDYVGDNIDRGQGVNLFQFIQEMCAAELDGRFRFNVNSANQLPMYVFYSRIALASQYSAANVRILPASLFREIGSEYEFGTELVNHLDITVYPRALGSAGTELARNGSPIRMDGLSSKTITLRYRDPDDPAGTCTAAVLIAPVPGNDYTGNLAADGTGEDYTGNIVVTAQNLTSSAEVTISNTATGTVYVTLLRLRGTPLTARQPVTISAVNAESVHRYGRVRQTQTVAGVDDLELIQRYADYIVAQRGEPAHRFRRVAFNFPADSTDPLWAVAFANDTNVISVQDTWIEDAAGALRNWIAGEAHVVDTSARTWVTTWYLEDYKFLASWKLEDADLGILDITTRLAF